MSPLERAKAATQALVDHRLHKPWVMGDYDARDRELGARDRRQAFTAVNGGRLQSECDL